MNELFQSVTLSRTAAPATAGSPSITHSTTKTRSVPAATVHNYNNYDPPLTPKSIKKKKVRFIETEDFIYYDPDEPPRDLKK